MHSLTGHDGIVVFMSQALTFHGVGVLSILAGSKTKDLSCGGAGEKFPICPQDPW